jgi:tetratricopeptide (TPR) repeat protein
VDVLERAMYIHPYDAAVHDRMAALYAATGRHAKAVRERRAILALNPVNRADALYRLAAALLEAGDSGRARREVLRALEIAPNFEQAQELLLRLRDTGR